MSELFVYSHRVETREVPGGWGVAVTTTKKSEAGLLDTKVHREPGVFLTAAEAEAAGWKFTREAFRPW